MPGYLVKTETVTVAGAEYVIRSLLDLRQSAGPSGNATPAGMSAATWSQFGNLSPSAHVLARAMHSFDLTGKRVLEIGAGLALASLVIHRREGDITASDWHPLSRSFLDENLTLNALGPLRHDDGPWADDHPALGEFDLIIGSDVLVERQQPDELANFIDRHAAPTVEVIIVDPDRGHRVAFCRAMTGLGYEFSAQTAEPTLENGDAFKGRFLNFKRSSGTAV